MTSLVLLWNASLALSGVALLALLLLLFARYVSMMRNVPSREARKAMTGSLLGGGERTGTSRLHRESAADLTLELAELVRGSDRERLMQNAINLGVPDVLRRRLRSRIAQDRLTAAETMAMFPGELRQEALKALDDRSRHVRLGAALALAQNNGAPQVAEVISRLRIGTSERSMLVVSLMRDLAETDPTGVEALLHDPALPSEVKLAASDALAASGKVENAQLVAWVAKAARENEGPLQTRIFAALRRLGHPRARGAVAAGLASADWQVRAAAAQAAGTIGLIDLVEPLGALLSDAQWWVRFRAGDALARLGREGRETLGRAMESGDDVAREAAVAIMAERGLR